MPNGVPATVLRRLDASGAEGLAALNAKILRLAQPLVSRGAWVEAYALQRHYASQRSPAETDARMTFRLETTQRVGGGRVKHQSQWINAFTRLLSGKRSNIQFGYVVCFPWGTGGLDAMYRTKPDKTAGFAYGTL